MRRTRSLRARLLAGVGAVLVVVLLTTGGLTLLVVHHVLVDRVDAQVVSQAAQSAGVLGARPGGPPGGPSQGGPAGEEAREGLGFLLVGLPVGSVGARVEDGAVRAASLAGTGGVPRLDVWTDEQAAALGRAGPEPSTVDVPGRGDYRVVTASAGDGGVVVGQPLAETTTVVSQLAVAALLLAALGIVAAVLASRAVLARGLAPLRRVAATATRVSGLPLDRGEVDLAVRVPERDTDPRTEVGQVGAALDRLLVHVAAALSARHRSETQVRQFVADASHELRTPLASVRGYAELARRHEADLPPEVAHALERVESQATRMSGLVEDLLLLARLDAGRPLEREVVELPLLVVDAVSDARVTAPDHRWRLDLPGPAEEEGADEQEGPADEDAGGAASLAVRGDAARLQQVLAALLANARTHTPPGTTVTARVRARPGEVEVVVEDDGPGVDPAVLPEVFERFARADTSRSRAAGSTGLGLAIARAVVTAHGGTVDVESAPGRTAFRVALPAAAAR
ncbi:ATP-binding protein [Pseudokineococcus sp. 5B2Z-1]|uniref:sensor histidine kinase n=1 Tax=Pseudokineococcus sp. 5B2Z-1 TaxID=3132744 RepID=UPI0030A83CA6